MGVSDCSVLVCTHMLVDLCMSKAGYVDGGRGGSITIGGSYLKTILKITGRLIWNVLIANKYQRYDRTRLLTRVNVPWSLLKKKYNDPKATY